MNPDGVLPRKRFVLSGHSAVIDPAIHALRDDLVDVDLAGLVFAPHYVRGLVCTVTNTTTVYLAPDYDAATVDHLNVGATLYLFDVSAGWGWIRTAKGIGYIRTDCIAPL